MLKYIPDVIDPLDGLFGRIIHGPLHRFTISTKGETTGLQVEHLMQQYGIRIWGRELEKDEEIGILVKRKQAIWAEYLLCRAGIPLTSQLIDQRNEIYREVHTENTMPAPWTESGIGPNSLVDHIVEWLDRLTS